MFGEKLKTLRNTADLTQEQLAEELNVSQQSVGLWERNKNFPNNDLLIKISEIFNVSIDYLLKDDNAIAEDKPKATSKSKRLASLQKKISNADEETLQELEAYLDFINYKKMQDNDVNRNISSIHKQGQAMVS